MTDYKKLYEDAIAVLMRIEPILEDIHAVLDICRELPELVEELEWMRELQPGNSVWIQRGDPRNHIPAVVVNVFSDHVLLASVIDDGLFKFDYTGRAFDRMTAAIVGDGYKNLEKCQKEKISEIH